jgi:hypothetical protein
MEERFRLGTPAGEAFPGCNQAALSPNSANSTGECNAQPAWERAYSPWKAPATLAVSSTASGISGWQRGSGKAAAHSASSPLWSA